MPGLKLAVWPTIRTTPARSAASIIRSQSSSVNAIGFSTSTCLPTLAASVAWSNVMLMWAADVDHVDLRAVAQRGGVREGEPAEVILKAVQVFGGGGPRRRWRQ